MSTEGTNGPTPDEFAPGAWDAALNRLEDVLLAAPWDRALPDLEILLEQANVPLSFVQQDERAIKLLGEAMLARPFASHDVIRRSRAHVEMMSLEVEVLAQRLRDPTTSAVVAEDAVARLRDLAAELGRLRDRL